mmetsp:Transcript_52141/g.52528  ORF Transcript_52141/g.52528 Transcript_52141/m.52528 type:complete len:84 (-) Transcript_52141:79-330(-)
MQDLRKWIENPDHVVESEGFTCEEGVKYLQRTIASSFCDEGKMTAKDAGCRCKSTTLMEKERLRRPQRRILQYFLSSALPPQW